MARTLNQIMNERYSLSSSALLPLNVQSQLGRTPSSQSASGLNMLNTPGAPLGLPETTPSTRTNLSSALGGPKPTTTASSAPKKANVLEGVWSALKTGGAWVSWSFSSIPDNAFMLSSMVTNRVASLFTYNADTKQYKSFQDKTLTQAITDVARAFGAGQIDVSKIDNQIMRNAAIDINEGRNILSGMASRSHQYYHQEELAVRARASKAVNFAMDVAGSMPQMAVMAMPHGMTVYAMNSFSGAINENVDLEDPRIRDMSYALYNASIEVASEMVFGLFAGTTSIFPGALKRITGNQMAPTTGMLLKSVLKNAAEEGFEEMIAFPFQMALDWRYNNPDAPLSSMVTWENAKQMGYAGLVGMAACGLMSLASVGRTANAARYAQAGGTNVEAYMNMRYTPEQRRKMNTLANQMMNKPLNSLTETEVTTFFNYFAEGIRKDNPVVLPILGLPQPMQGPMPVPGQATAATPVDTTPVVEAPKQTFGQFNNPIDPVNFIPEGTTVQEKNRSVLTQQIAANDVALAEAQRTDNTFMVMMHQELKATLQADLDAVNKDPKANPLNLREGAEPATDAQGSPVAAPEAASTAQDTSVPFTAGESAQQAPAAVQGKQQARGEQKVTSTKRADHPSYLSFLQSQVERIEASLRGSKLSDAQKQSIRRDRLPAAQEKLRLEQEAVARGQTTEVVKSSKPSKPSDAKTAEQQTAKPAVKTEPVKAPAPKAAVAPAKTEAKPKQASKKTAIPKKAAPAPKPKTPAKSGALDPQYVIDVAAQSRSELKNLDIKYTLETKVDPKFEALKKVAKDVSGVDVYFFSVKGDTSKTTNGGFAPNVDNASQIFLNVSMKKSDVALNVIGHEMFHVAQRNKAGDAFVKTVLDANNINTAKDALAHIKSLHGESTAAHYEAKYKNNTKALFEEVAAMRAGELINSKVFWDAYAKRLGNRSKSVLTKLADWLRSVKADTKALDTEIDQLLTAMDDTLKALAPVPAPPPAFVVVPAQAKPKQARTPAQILASVNNMMKRGAVVTATDMAGKDPTVVRKAIELASPEITQQLSSATLRGDMLGEVSITLKTDAVKINPSSFTKLEGLNGTALSKHNMDVLVKFYKDIGMVQYAQRFVSAYDLANRLNKYTFDQLKKNKKMTAELVESYEKMYQDKGNASLDNVYISISALVPDVKATLIRSIKLSDSGLLFTMVFTDKPLSYTQLELTNLMPVFETREVSLTPKQSAAQKIKNAPQAVPQTIAETHQTNLYMEAGIQVVRDTDAGEYRFHFLTEPTPQQRTELYRERVRPPVEGRDYWRIKDKGKETAQAVKRAIEGITSVVDTVTTGEAKEASNKSVEISEMILEDLYKTRLDYSDVPYTSAPGGNPEAMKKLRQNLVLNTPKKTWTQKFSEVKEAIVRNVFRGATPHLPRHGKEGQKYAELTEKFIRYPRAEQQSGAMADQHVLTMYDNIPRKKYPLFAEYVVLKSMADDIKRKRMKDFKNNPWGFETEAQVLAELSAREADILRPENRFLYDIYNQRKIVLEAVRQKYIDLAKQVGYDPSLIWTHEEYYHHVMNNFQDIIQKGITEGKQFSKTFLFEFRNNVDTPYLTDVALADWLTVKQMYKDMQTLELIREVKTFDEANTYKPGTALPDGMSELRLSEFGGNLFPVKQIGTILEAQGVEILKAMGISPDSATGRSFLSSVAEQAKMDTRMVVPTPVVNQVRSTLQSMPEGNIARELRRINRMWKSAVLRGPETWFRYMRNNFMGDFQAVIMGEPKVLLKAPQAIKEMYGYFKHNRTTLNMQLWIGRDGLSSGMTEIELGKFQQIPSLKFYNDGWSAKRLARAAANTFRRGGAIDQANQFREQILRYSAFLYYMDSGLNASDLPANGNYVASNRWLINGMKSRDARAAKMATDLLGAYNDTSVLTSYVSDHAVPFIRFRAINLTRTARMINNMFVASPSMQMEVGRTTAQKLGMAARMTAVGTLKLGMFTTKAMSYVMAALVLNRLVNKEADDKLPEYIRNSVHFTLGEWNGKVHYLGSFDLIEDLMEMFGFENHYGAMYSMLSSRADFKEIVSDMWQNPLNNFIQSMFPLYKMTRGLVTGTTDFPETRKVRDAYETFFSGWGFRETYKILTGKPIKDGKVWDSISKVFAPNVEADYSAYWNVKAKTEQYLEDIGKPLPSWEPNLTDKGNAIYYFKMAVRLGDDDAAMKYITSYIANGGTYQSFNSSMASLHPLSYLPNSMRAAYLGTLTKQEHQEYLRAKAFYDDMMKDGTEKFVEAMNSR